MGKSKKKRTKHNVPQKSSAKPKALPIKFDLGQQVFRYMVATRVQALLAQKKLMAKANFYGGILQGYDDWFAIMGIDQDKFDEIQFKFRAKDINDQADKVLKLELQPPKKGRIFIPGAELTPEQYHAAKETWVKSLHLEGKI